MESRCQGGAVFVQPWVVDAFSRFIGHRVMAPSPLGTFLRSFTFGHVRQLDRVAETVLVPPPRGVVRPRSWRPVARQSCRGQAGHSRCHSTGRNQTEPLVTGQTRHPT